MTLVGPDPIAMVNDPDGGASGSLEPEVSQEAIQDNLNYLKTTRRYLRGKVTRLCTNVSANFAAMSSEDKCALVADLEAIKLKLEASDLSISKVMWSCTEDPQKWDEELESCDSYGDKVVVALRMLKPSTVNVASAALPSSVIPPLVNKLKLPQLTLPTYGHLKGENLHEFFTSFEDIIDKYCLTDREKFVFLQKQLINEPLTIIKALVSSQQCYDQAKSLLTKAFGQPTVQKFEVIQQLTELRLGYEDDPYTFIGEMMTINEAFKSLKIDSSIILQYFFWRALNDGMKSQFIAITNCNKPSLEQLNENIFEATERYLSANKKYLSPSLEDSTVGMAAGVSYRANNDEKAVSSFRPCLLCTKDGSAADHPIYKCVKFSKASDKLDRLKSMNACAKCTFLGHKKSDCKFKFKKPCTHCGALHYSFLCFKADKKIDGALTGNVVSITEEEPDSEEGTNVGEETAASSAIVSSHSLTSETSDSTILPTFTAHISKQTVIRVLKDSACQSNFILESVAKQQKLKMVRKISLTVNGFNSSKHYNTSVVELDLKIGASWFRIEAVCVPEIKPVLVLPGLRKVIEQFVGKGYKLADKCLNKDSDTIDRLQFILGACSSYCIPSQTRLFGQNPPSAFADTDQGILIYGSVKDFLSNTRYLPVKCNFENALDNSCHLPPDTLLDDHPAGGDSHSVSQCQLAAQLHNRSDDAPSSTLPDSRPPSETVHPQSDGEVRPSQAEFDRLCTDKSDSQHLSVACEVPDDCPSEVNNYCQLCAESVGQILTSTKADDEVVQSSVSNVVTVTAFTAAVFIPNMNSTFPVVSAEGIVNETELLKATEDILQTVSPSILDKQCAECLSECLKHKY